MSEAQALWTWDELVAAAEGETEGEPTRAITGFSIDTRSLEPGEVFVALAHQRDGHAFVPEAFRRQAAAAVVRRDYGAAAGIGPLIRVDDPLRALERIAAAARARLTPQARVIAVTGSAGKTGTKDMLRACLASAGKTHAAEKSFNNQWGVPLTLARMPADTDFAVIEIGMNHAGEIRPLTRLARPHIAIITNVLPVHVGNFEDGIDGVARAKAEIFEGLRWLAEQGETGTAIVPRDSAHFAFLATEARSCGAKVLTFARHADDPPAHLADALVSGAGDPQAEALSPDGAEHLTLRVRDRPRGVGAAARGAAERVYQLKLSPRGSPAANNLGAVALALDAVGQLSQSTLDVLKTYRPTAGRGARTRRRAGDGELLLIDDSYNANPASVTAALAALGLVPRERFRRRVAVLGDMRELGRFADAYHRELANPVRAVLNRDGDLLFACGPHMKALYNLVLAERRGQWTATSDELVAHVLSALAAGDVVLVKGSLGTRMAPIVDAITDRFPKIG